VALAGSPRHCCCRWRRAWTGVARFWGLSWSTTLEGFGKHTPSKAAGLHATAPQRVPLCCTGELGQGGWPRSNACRLCPAATCTGDSSLRHPIAPPAHQRAIRRGGRLRATGSEHTRCRAHDARTAAGRLRGCRVCAPWSLRRRACRAAPRSLPGTPVTSQDGATTGHTRLVTGRGLA